MTKLADWRQAPAVLEARQAVETAQQAIGALERQLRESQAAIRAGEDALSRPEVTADMTLVMEVRQRLLEARQTAQALEAQAVTLYADARQAQQRLDAVALEAQQAAWSALLPEYVAACQILQDKVTTAVQAEEEAQRLWRVMEAQFGAVGWLVSPYNASTRVGCGCYGQRKLTRLAFQSWREWSEESGATGRHKGRKIAA